MKKKKGLALVAVLLAIFGVYAYFLNSVSSQTNDAQVSDDAIGVRIVPNPNHYSVYRWYESQGFKGSPQALTVDGYEALRDGRTVYVNAANINVNTKKIYTNIYLISYNQDPNAKTVDILGQIISHWKFNENLPAEVATCSISALKCEKDSDCSTGQICSTSNSTCTLKTAKNCLVDTDCPANFFCDSLKSKVARDIKRVGKLEEIREALSSYRSANGRYPLLSGGTYLPGKTTSLWPSWNDVLMPALAIKQTFVDPVNRFGMCPGFDTKTCWNNGDKTFVYAPVGATLKLPLDSYALVYSTNDVGSEYNLCSVMESRNTSIPNLMYSFDPKPATVSDCVTATGILASGNASNAAPKIADVQLKGISGREFNGFVRATDSDNDPLSWSMSLVSGSWPGWSAAPVLKMTSDAGQRKIFATRAGNVGDYLVRITVNDTKGGSVSTTTKITIASATSFAQADEYIYRLDQTVPFSYSFYVSGSSAPAPTVVSGRNVLILPGITRTVTNEGINSLKVTYKGIFASSTDFFADSETVYSLSTSGNATNNFAIKIKVDKPTLQLDCLTQVRAGKRYECKLGPNKQGTHDIVWTTNITTTAFNGRLTASNTNGYTYLSGTTTTPVAEQTINITATNEYGATTTASLKLRANSYCGDGIRQPTINNPLPNTEGKGGVYNDGYEACDGNNPLYIANTPANSSSTRQYACNTTTVGQTPYPITGNGYCIFKSPLDGGGYCKDTYCETQFENITTCPFDCNPNTYLGENIGGTFGQTDPILPDQGGGACGSAGACDPGYECTGGQCVKKCWNINQASDVSVFVKEGDAINANTDYHTWVDKYKTPIFNYKSVEINNNAPATKICHESNNGDHTPSGDFVNCTKIGLDNPICIRKNGEDVNPTAGNNCPVGYRSNLVYIGRATDECKENENNLAGWRTRLSWTCYGQKSVNLTKCYLDDCRPINSTVNDGTMDENGTCVKNPPIEYCDTNANCSGGKECVGAVASCSLRTNAQNTNIPCQYFSQQICVNNDQDCEWKTTTRGTCAVSGGGNSCTPYCAANSCGTNGCGGTCACPSSAYTCTSGQCVLANTPPPSNCGIGNYINEQSNKCETCPIGFYCSDGKNAEVCRGGTYTSTTGNSVCTTCEPGYYCVGRASRIGCAAGTYRPIAAGTSQGSCTDCAAGTYTDTTGNTVCKDCLAGTYNLTTRNTSCKQCDAGYYCLGKTSFVACGAGTKRSTEGASRATDCIRCSAGTYSLYSASTSCTSCSPGYYCTGGTNVTPCGIGTYNASSGGDDPQDCRSCVAGNYNNSTGNTSCIRCEANYFCGGGASRVSCSTYSRGYAPYCPAGSSVGTACRPTPY